MLNRNQAVKYLQLPLSDFRMMCILLHISPKLVKHQQLYLQKDIKFLNNHPLLPVIRELKVLKRKCVHYYHKDNAIYEDYMTQVNTLLIKQMPMLIQQNYPKFYNLWYDLDDILSLLYCIKHLPSNDYIGSEEVEKTANLLSQFELLMKKLNIGVQKSFISIKGLYVQFQLQEQPITFVVPLHSHQTQDIDVDYKVMATFHMYYQSLLDFFLFKMAKLNKFDYPLQDDGIMCQSTINDSPVTVEDKDVDMTLNDFDKQSCIFKKSCNSTLFMEKSFILHREVNQTLFTFLIESCGGRVISNAEGIEDVIEVVDKPLRLVKLAKETNRAVQPQYIVDCINANKLIAFEGYRAGEELPSHVSPFEDTTGNLATEEMIDEAEQAIMRQEELDNLGEESDMETGFEVKDKEDLSIKACEDSIQLKKEVAKSTMTQKERRLLGHVVANKNKKLKEAEGLAKKRLNNKKQKQK